MKPCIDYFISRVLGPLLNVFDYHGQNVRMLYDPKGRQLAAFNLDGVIHQSSSKNTSTRLIYPSYCSHSTSLWPTSLR